MRKEGLIEPFFVFLLQRKEDFETAEEITRWDLEWFISFQVNSLRLQQEGLEGGSWNVLCCGKNVLYSKVTSLAPASYLSCRSRRISRRTRCPR